MYDQSSIMLQRVMLKSLESEYKQLKAQNSLLQESYDKINKDNGNLVIKLQEMIDKQQQQINIISP